MRYFKSILLPLVALALLLSLAACHAQEPFEAGEPLTPDQINHLKTELEKVQQEQEGGQGSPEKGEGEAPLPDFITVYWLAKGSVYHCDENCYHIREKTNVESGSVAAANEAGKERLCSACAD